MDMKIGRLPASLAMVAIVGIALSVDADASEPSASPGLAAETALEGASAWGPLAIVDDPNEDLGKLSGTLLIGECVVLQIEDAPESEVTLAWRHSETRWDASTGRIQFTDTELGPIQLAHGDRITVGGWPSLALDLRSPADAWLQEPNAACPGDTWLVDRVYADDVASVRWGPLAVADDPVVPTVIGTTVGRLVVGDECVTFEISGVDPMTLVWPDDQTRWRAEKQRIVFDDPRRGTLRLKSGDRMSLGGARVATARTEGATPGDSSASAPAPSWVREPADACPKSLFVIREIVR